jgi:hypothetical protein
MDLNDYNKNREIINKIIKWGTSTLYENKNKLNPKPTYYRRNNKDQGWINEIETKKKKTKIKQSKKLAL